MPSPTNRKKKTAILTSVHPHSQGPSKKKTRGKIQRPPLTCIGGQDQRPERYHLDSFRVRARERKVSGERRAASGRGLAPWETQELFKEHDRASPNQRRQRQRQHGHTKREPQKALQRRSEPASSENGRASIFAAAIKKWLTKTNQGAKKKNSGENLRPTLAPASFAELRRPERRTAWCPGRSCGRSPPRSSPAARSPERWAARPGTPGPPPATKTPCRRRGPP